MNTPILYPGDVIHLVLPSTGSGREDNRIIEELRTEYARFGVNLHVATAHTGADFKVVAVFRKPTLVPVETEK
jgi:hypothetical protein